MSDVLDRSEARFGTLVRYRYARLIVQALQDLAHDPDRSGVRWAIVDGERFGLYHLRHSRDRSGLPGERVQRPRHVIVLRPAGDDVLDVLGILHDAMLPDRHLRRLGGEGP